MRRPLVLGASGQLGTELTRLVGAAAGVTHERLSITDAAAVDSLIASRQPDVVFNCAAYNAVDRAESEPEVAMRVNRDGTANVVGACARHGARLVHFSTNFVFDGALDRAYLESDPPRPLSAYGRSKLAGEVEVASHPGNLIIRTAAVYGHVGRGFPDRIVEQAARAGKLRVVADQRVNPTYAADLAAAAIELAEGDLDRVHVTGSGCASWYEFARAVLEETGVAATVEEVTTGDYPAAAARPPNGCLESSLVGPLRPWRDALKEWAERRKNP